MTKIVVFATFYLLLFYFFNSFVCFDEFIDKINYRNRVRDMFYHAYDSYLTYAYPLDELRPLTCDGIDTWGSFSLTLVDSLDTLVVMGNGSEFVRATNLLQRSLDSIKNLNVSVFETNIRIVGGLLSAHLLSRRAGASLEVGWPCTGPLLRLAENFARRLLPAFNTATGMPYGTVNLRDGVPQGETPITCTAGITTFLLEFGALSRLTGDPVFENVALRALRAMWQYRSLETGLVGNHIDVMSGKWTAKEAGIGAGVDSYFEYLVKGSALFYLPELQSMFNEYKSAVDKYLRHDDWFFWVNMDKGSVTKPIFQNLEAFWPGVLTLAGHTDDALRIVHNYHQVWKQYGATPEFYSVPKGETLENRFAYPLRPELAESLFYLYRATRDSTILRMAVDIVESIEHSAKTRCGYATIHDVNTHTLENRMESFFLAETTKYLYLIFDDDNFLFNQNNTGPPVWRDTPGGRCSLESAGWVFNTEAHPLDAAALKCCSNQFKEQRDALLQLHDGSGLVDIVRMLDLDMPGDEWLLGPLEHNSVKAQKEEIPSNSNKGQPPNVSATTKLHALLRNLLDGVLGESKEKIVTLLKESEETTRGTAANLTVPVTVEVLTCAVPSFSHRFALYGEVNDLENSGSGAEAAKKNKMP